ncbi:MAG: diaminopimelate epimerase [Bacteroidales bacterium]
MKIQFSKYHGAGNDFILIDNRKLQFSPEENKIARLCNRRLGAGADGLILLSDSISHNFEMKYYNSDGREGTMCGNGGRCVTSFAKDLGIITDKAEFSAIDGTHESVVLQFEDHFSNISVKLNDVSEIIQKEEYFLIDTGSPHYVRFVNKVDRINVFEEGKRIRWEQEFQPTGVNVNFVELNDDRLIVRTFERGVEDVTLSCGTGVTASAIAASVLLGNGKTHFNIDTYGGRLDVRFQVKNKLYTNVWLTGPVTKVFHGIIDI